PQNKPSLAIAKRCTIQRVTRFAVEMFPENTDNIAGRTPTCVGLGVRFDKGEISSRFHEQSPLVGTG
ncbi:hypothetical protein, partial [Corynebacterium flavescens]|uniref:hypothetical protein n=1 Tax=Corynebacterium flavescens TaxID=28028 RepID=UPI001C3FE749